MSMGLDWNVWGWQGTAGGGGDSLGWVRLPCCPGPQLSVGPQASLLSPGTKACGSPGCGHSLRLGRGGAGVTPAPPSGPGWLSLSPAALTPAEGPLAESHAADGS